MVIPQKGGLCANSLEPDYKAEDVTILRLLRGETYLSLSGYTLNVITCIPIREGRGVGDRRTKEKTQKRRQYDHRGRGWSDVASDQGMLTALEIKRSQGMESLLEALPGHSPANTLTLYFWPSEL